MKQAWKDWRFWVCALLYAMLFCLISCGWYTEIRTVAWSDAYVTYLVFTYVPRILTLLSWVAGLYNRWTGRWKRSDMRLWGVLVILCGGMNLPACFYSNGALVCAAASLVLGVGAIALGRS